MSHKVEIEVKIDNEQALQEALTEMGYEVRMGKHELSAFDWTMECDMSIKKDNKQLNIGFRKEEDRLVMEADFWGSGINQKEFEESLNQLHAKHKVKNWLLKKGYKVTYEEDLVGNVRVVGSKWS